MNNLINQINNLNISLSEYDTLEMLYKNISKNTFNNSIL